MRLVVVEAGAGQAGGVSPLQRLCFNLCLVAVLAVAGYSFYTKDRFWPPLRGDGVGYYAYLPGLVLAHDPALGTYVSQLEKDHLEEYGLLVRQLGNGYYTKYPLGTALLMLPGFLTATAVAWISGQPLNGLSPPFMHMLFWSAWFFAWAGMNLLFSVLARRYGMLAAYSACLACLLGTNFLFYATNFVSMSHVYSFFLVAALLWLGQRRGGAGLAWIGLALGLILVTRPTNLTAGLLLLPWLRDGGLAALRRPKALLALALFLAPVALQMAYWKAVCGFWVYYSYGSEGFNFLDPHITDVLFSLHRGLFVFCPLLAFGVLGLALDLRRDARLAGTCLALLAVNTYVIASWHDWTYGYAFGMRPFVDFLPVFAVGIAAYVRRVAATQWLYLSLFLMLVMSYYTLILLVAGAYNLLNLKGFSLMEYLLIFIQIHFWRW